MVANISQRDGKAEAFTALTPAWWDRDGEYMTDHYLTSEEVWGQQGVLNFEYDLKEIADAETGKVIPRYRCCVRQDTGAVIGCGMTDDYRIVQPRQAFKFLDSLMMDGVMKYASAGVLGKGEEIWILATIPSREQPIPGETQQRYVLWTDRFDAGGTLKCFPCVTRVECANTLSIALGERNAKQFKGIRHTGDMEEKLNDARQLLIEAEESFQRYNQDVRKLVSTPYTHPQAKDYIEELFPTPADDAAKRTKTVHRRKVNEVRQAFRHPSSQIGEMQGTWWQLVNAVTYAVDHGQIYSFRGANKETNKFRSLMMGDGSDLKRKAFDVALEMAS